MIRHIVLFKLRPEVSRESPAVGRALDAAQRLSKIPGVKNWQMLTNLSQRDIAQDFGCIGDFENAAGLAAFLADDRHLASADLWAEIATWVILDHDDTVDPESCTSFESQTEGP